MPRVTVVYLAYNPYYSYCFVEYWAKGKESIAASFFKFKFSREALIIMLVA